MDGQLLVAMKAGHGADVLRQHTDAIGAVGDAGRQSEEQQERERQEGTAGREHVDHRRDKPDGEQSGILEGRHLL